jgi:hypothetical protein
MPHLRFDFDNPKAGDQVITELKRPFGHNQQTICVRFFEVDVAFPATHDAGVDLLSLNLPILLNGRELPLNRMLQEKENRPLRQRNQASSVDIATD